MSGKKRQKWASYRYKRFNFLVIKEHKKSNKEALKKLQDMISKVSIQTNKKGGNFLISKWLIMRYFDLFLIFF